MKIKFIKIKLNLNLKKLLTRFSTRYDVNKHLSASWSERINRSDSTTKRRLVLAYDQEIRQW